MLKKKKNRKKNTRIIYTRTNGFGLPDVRRMPSKKRPWNALNFLSMLLWDSSMEYMITIKHAINVSVEAFFHWENGEKSLTYLIESERTVSFLCNLISIVYIALDMNWYVAQIQICFESIAFEKSFIIAKDKKYMFWRQLTSQ